MNINRVICIFVLLQYLNAQDVIHLKNGKILRGEVTEQTSDKIILKKSAEKTDTLFFSDVNKIFYSKTSKYYGVKIPGRKEQETKKNDNNNDKKEERKIHKNYVGMEIEKFFFSSVSLSYERVLNKKNNLTLRIPVTIGRYTLGDQTNVPVFNFNNWMINQTDGRNPLEVAYRSMIGGLGLHLHYYPFESFHKYFAGIYTNVIQFAYKVDYFDKYIYYVDYYGYPQQIIEIKKTDSKVSTDGIHFSAGLLNGYHQEIDENLAISFAVYTGLGKNNYPSVRDFNSVFFHIFGLFKMGIKF
jgi:hypothetical protein